MKAGRCTLAILFMSMLVASAMSRKLLAEPTGFIGVMDTISEHTFHGELSDSLEAFIDHLSGEFQGFIDSLHDSHADFFNFKHKKEYLVPAPESAPAETPAPAPAPSSSVVG